MKVGSYTEDMQGREEEGGFVRWNISCKTR